jgi:hypothetical protein
MDYNSLPAIPEFDICCPVGFLPSCPRAAGMPRFGGNSHSTQWGGGRRQGGAEHQNSREVRLGYRRLCRLVLFDGAVGTMSGLKPGRT